MKAANSRGLALPRALTAYGGWSGSFHDMIPEIDTWRIATLIFKRYVDEAEAESARRADELWEVGDAAGVVVWRRVAGAVRQAACERDASRTGTLTAARRGEA